MPFFYYGGGIERDRGFTNYELTVKICFQSCSILQYHTPKEFRKIQKKNINFEFHIVYGHYYKGSILENLFSSMLSILIGNTWDIPDFPYQKFIILNKFDI